MTLLRESYLYHIWMTLLSIYDDSMVHRVLAVVGSWCSRQIDESRVLRVLCREGMVARAWPESCLCRLLTWLVNLPGSLLHRLYGTLQATFEDSFFARLAFSMGEQTAVAQSWLIMLLWVIPFSHTALWVLPCCWCCSTLVPCTREICGWIWQISDSIR